VPAGLHDALSAASAASVKSISSILKSRIVPWDPAATITTSAAAATQIAVRLMSASPAMDTGLWSMFPAIRSPGNTEVTVSTVGSGWKVASEVHGFEMDHPQGIVSVTQTFHSDLTYDPTATSSLLTGCRDRTDRDQTEIPPRRMGLKLMDR
jgi:hypothetical protein